MKIRCTVTSAEVHTRVQKGFTFHHQEIAKAELLNDKGEVVSMQTNCRHEVQKDKDGNFTGLLQPGTHLTTDGHYIDKYRTLKRSSRPQFETPKAARAAA